MSRIEQIIRELSDLRDFQRKLERRHEITERENEATVAEEQAGYNTTNSPLIKRDEG